MLEWLDKLTCRLFGHSYIISVPCEGRTGQHTFTCIYCKMKEKVQCEEYHCTCCGKHSCKLSKCYCKKCCVEYLFSIVPLDDLSFMAKTYIYCCNVYGHEVTAMVVANPKFDPIRDHLSNALLLV